MNILNNYNTISKKENKLNSRVRNIEPDFIDIISKKVINSRDITDTVTMPRSIFKGYLCFTTGTVINSIAPIFSKTKLAKGLTIISSMLSILGTYNFVKPFLIKNKELTKTEK